MTVLEQQGLASYEQFSELVLHECQFSQWYLMVVMEWLLQRLDVWEFFYIYSFTFLVVVDL